MRHFDTLGLYQNVSGKMIRGIPDNDIEFHIPVSLEKYILQVTKQFKFLMMHEFISVLFTLKRIGINAVGINSAERAFDFPFFLFAHRIQLSFRISEIMVSGWNLDVAFFIIEPRPVPDGITINVMTIRSFNPVAFSISIGTVIQSATGNIGGKFGLANSENHFL